MSWAYVDVENLIQMCRIDQVPIIILGKDSGEHEVNANRYKQEEN